MRIQFFLLMSSLVIYTGCSGNVSLRRVDNPAIRKIQEEETARHGPDNHMRAATVRHLGRRVKLVFSGDILRFSNGFPPAGRATALTADGYFLTAYHVVEERPFYIEETEVIREPPSDGFSSSEVDRYLSKIRKSGRVVWADPVVDLAIVKCPVEDQPFFKDMEVSPSQDRIVFTADDEGYAVLYPDEHGTFDLRKFVGNRAFFAAGSIISAGKIDAASRSKTFSTTLVARGGMSGAPLVTADYELCGIISRVEGLGLFQEPKTIATMIEPELIREVIDSDRKSR